MIAAVPQSAQQELPADAIGSLLVFSDDWGRHPSSCQHLVRRLLPRYPVTWVNTIGTRAPRLDLATLRRVSEKLQQWGRQPEAPTTAGQLTEQIPASGPEPGLTVLNPRMWPWFGRLHDRRLNRWLLARQLTPWIRRMPQPVVALTTLPITADLPDVLPVHRWVYYCVDDFSQWPGLDGSTLQRMDREMLARADALVAVSETLQSGIAAQGRQAELLTHGVDVELWQPTGSPGSATGTAPAEGDLLASLPSPLVVFWGVLDRRMDTPSLLQLSADLTQGTIVLIGPQQDPDPQILGRPNVVSLPPQPLHLLPQIAAQASVLIMPYADLPVTRAMQPLKLKEYMATGRPVVVRRLPSTEAWSDCLDSADSPAEFSQLVRYRLAQGVSPEQLRNRQRLLVESWSAKALVLEQILRGRSGVPGAAAADRTAATAAAVTLRAAVTFGAPGTLSAPVQKVGM